VIPSHARETRLAFALEGLAEQTLSPAEFEVVVVRGDSSPGPFAGAPPKLRVQFLSSPELGPVPQRNLGWRAAEAPLVAFIDDDCRPDPHWLEALLEAGDGEGAIVQGRTEPDPSELHLLFGLARTVEINGPSGLYETCNLLYPRALLERLGGFAQEFRLPHWGEDTDLGLRAEEAGAQLRYADGAVVWHAVHPNPLHRAIREAGRRRRFARLVSRHPGVRRTMPGGIFVNRAHVGTAAGLLGLALAVFTRRRGAAAIAALGWLPYAGHVVGQFAAQGGELTARRVARLVLHLPARGAVDVAETVATARGAIEDRTLVL
jgi:GT2 family glycosyltransferase